MELGNHHHCSAVEAVEVLDPPEGMTPVERFVQESADRRPQHPSTSRPWEGRVADMTLGLEVPVLNPDGTFQAERELLELPSEPRIRRDSLASK